MTFVCFRLRVDLTIACLLYLTIIVLLSVTDAIVASIFVSGFSVLCLDYFFAPPLFSVQLNDPLDIVALVVFLGTALLITRLMSLRKRAEEALLTLSIGDERGQRLINFVSERRRHLRKRSAVSDPP